MTMATRTRRKLGYVDYERMPDYGKRYEIFDGELYVTPAATPLHQRLSKRLSLALVDYFEARAIGEVFYAPIDLVLGEHDIAQPDLLVVAEPAQISDRAIEGPPLLVIEILSPSTRAQDRGVKMQRYARLGIRHYWIVDPDAQTIECFRLEGDAYRLVAEFASPETLTHSDFSDLAIDLGALWR
jgi:Uma2 family endonuclease